jgi:peptidoglycan/xylan/chitin deacetylase (PgdA/CDA1 family)
VPAVRKPLVWLRRRRGVWLARYLRLRCAARRAGLVLVYHRVEPTGGDPEHELVPALGVRLFEAQLSHLAAWYRVVAPSEIIAASARRRRGERYPVAITFDDDLRSHARLAMPTLRRTRAPAAFFLCGASLEHPYRFWWELLQSAVDERRELAGLGPAGLRPGREGIHGLGAAIEAASPDERMQIAARLAEIAGPDPEDAGMRAADVAALAAAGHEIGFHTLRHDLLPALDDAGLDAALRDGREPLERSAGRTLAAISYPHGRADARVAAAARRSGYEYGFTGAPGAVTPHSDPLLLPRIDVVNTTLGEFARQLVGTLERAVS